MSFSILGMASGGGSSRSNDGQHHADAIEQSLLRKIEELLEQSFAKQSKELASLLRDHQQLTTQVVDTDQLPIEQAAGDQGQSDCVLDEAYDDGKMQRTEAITQLKNSQKPEKRATYTTVLQALVPTMPTSSNLELGRQVHAKKGDRLQEFVQGIPFQLTVVIMIVLQAIFLGWEANQRLTVEKERLEEKSNAGKLPEYFHVVGIVFHVFFGVEILIRAAAWKAKFFNVKDQEFFFWNIFDTTIFLGLFLELIDLDIDLLRAVRLLRVARILRIIRRFSKLKKMIYALMHSMGALVPLMIMLLLTVYIFSLAFMQGAYNRLADLSVEEFKDTKFSDWKLRQKNWIIFERFGTLMLTMRSLYACITGGDGWDYLFETIMKDSYVYSILAVFFTLFFIFAVMNVVTGVFVDEAMKISQIDKEIKISDSIADEKEILQDIKQFVTSLDTDHDGTVTYDELVVMLNNEEIQRWLVGLDISLDLDNVDHILKVLDPDRTGRIDPEHFVDVLGKLKGEARSADLVILNLQVKQLDQKLRELLQCGQANDKQGIRASVTRGDFQRLDSRIHKLLTAHHSAILAQLGLTTL